MNAVQKLKHIILLRDAEMASAYGEDERGPLPAINADTVDDIYDVRGEDWALQDAEQEVREGEVETGLSCESSGHYESKSVAAKAPDGSWVGWTYWYGGGKHGEPEAIDWLGEAYDLAVTEEEKVVTVRTFTKVEPA